MWFVKQETGLQSVLCRFLMQIYDGRLLSLNTLDGVEIMTGSQKKYWCTVFRLNLIFKVARVENKVEMNTEDALVINYLSPSCTKSFEQA